ncbi:Arc family DNA-binding protein [uncultured Bacteroides sp.]|uniref:Arc family DNA-binding protein n=1 Tax=uncultured Bacteroides sp. TaxID=162156 RepID=UPI002AAAA897|nr:Arc family DNA-binding protein [uncultured Bacteroides sp.]
MAKKESSTKSFVLRIDPATMEAIEKWASDEFRSTNGQLQWIIAEALKKSGRLKNRKSSPKDDEINKSSE